MNSATMTSFLRPLILACVMTSPLYALPDAGWLLPEDGASYAHTPVSSSNSVPFVVEISTAIPSGNYLDIYSGPTKIQSLLIESVSNGLRRYSGWVPFYSTGAFPLTGKVSDGFNETTIFGPMIQVVSPAPAPTFFPAAAGSVTAVSMTVNCGVDSHGVRLNWSDIAWNYGTSTAYGTRVADRGGVIGREPAVEKIRSERRDIRGLQPSTTYHYRLVVNGVPGPDQTTTTTANNLPIARDDIGVLNADGSSEIYVLSNDEDEGVSADANPAPVTISIATQPAHGLAEVSISGTPRIRFVADTTFDETDEFTYTITDQFGGQSTARVVVGTLDKFFNAVSARFVTAVLDAEQRPIGTLTVKTGKGGRFTGSVSYYGVLLPFSGDLMPTGANGVNAVVEISRKGVPPLALFFTVGLTTYDASRLPWIDAMLSDPVTGLETWVYGPALLEAGAVVAEAGKFAMAMPNPEVGAIAGITQTPPPTEIDNSGTPKGHAFATMKLSSRGAMVLSGRTGDNRPFSVGSRMRGDHTLLMTSRSRNAKPTSIYGILGFDAALATKTTGTVRWQGTERSSGAYQGGFRMELNADGTKIADNAEIFSFPENTPKRVKVSIGNHNGGLLTESTMELINGRTLDNGPGNEYRISIAINPKTRTFQGTVKKGLKTVARITGVVPAGERKGLGVAGQTGFDAPVELNAL